MVLVHRGADLIRGRSNLDLVTHLIRGRSELGGVRGEYQRSQGRGVGGVGEQRRDRGEVQSLAGGGDERQLALAHLVRARVWAGVGVGVGVGLRVTASQGQGEG